MQAPLPASTEANTQTSSASSLQETYNKYVGGLIKSTGIGGDAIYDMKSVQDRLVHGKDTSENIPVAVQR